MVNKTNLVQMSISDPNEAISYFNTTTGDSIPIVLVPSSRLCCSCCFSVPSGTNSIIENCGEDDAPEQLAEAGLHCGPYWKQVAYMVTPQAITYNAPVKKCPTRDNVMVDCDLSLVIHIGPMPDQIKAFVYKLGARRFNEYLSAAADEGIRQLVRDTALDDVYELRGSGGQAGPESLLASLSETFQPYGVVFKRAAITDVHIGRNLIKILQGTTEFSAKITEAKKEHELEMKKIMYSHDQDMKTKDRDYDRRIQDAQNDQKVALVDRKKQEVDAQSRRNVNVTMAEEQASVIIRRAQAEFDVVTAEAEQANQKLLASIESKAQTDRIGAEQEAKTMIADSQAELDAARDRAEAILAVASAEGNSADKLKVMREHKLRMAHFEVSENIAKRSKVVISGQTGEDFIANMVGFSPSLDL